MLRMEFKNGGRVILEMQREGVSVIVMSVSGPLRRSEKDCEEYCKYGEKPEDRK